MKLKHITFTGVDERTNISRLREIQQAYPIAEFGVLTSYHWYENGNRYLNPRMFKYLLGNGLNLSLHICGRAAKDFASGESSDIHYLTWGKYNLFKRIQLNLANRKNNPEIVSGSLWDYQEIIIQQKGIDNLDLYQRTVKDRIERPYIGEVSVLLDASGGHGIDTPIEILNTKAKVGYAGGFNPENVADKLEYLFENVPGDFWIDMETGVRTDDWFDLDKVIKVLEICQPIINKYSWDQLPENKSLFKR